MRLDKGGFSEVVPWPGVKIDLNARGVKGAVDENGTADQFGIKKTVV